MYAQNRRLSPPEVVKGDETDEVRIPLTVVMDGNLHRYILEGSGIRFIVLKTDIGVAAAFDACEICGTQGYVQEGGAVICLNCSADINSATIGQGGGCNPVPLASKVEGDSLVIAVNSILKESGRFRE